MILCFWKYPWTFSRNKIPRSKKGISCIVMPYLCVTLFKNWVHIEHKNRQNWITAKSKNFVIYHWWVNQLWFFCLDCLRMTHQAHKLLSCSEIGNTSSIVQKLNREWIRERVVSPGLWATLMSNQNNSNIDRNTLERPNDSFEVEKESEAKMWRGDGWWENIKSTRFLCNRMILPKIILTWRNMLRVVIFFKSKLISNLIIGSTMNKCFRLLFGRNIKQSRISSVHVWFSLRIFLIPKMCFTDCESLRIANGLPHQCRGKAAKWCKTAKKIYCDLFGCIDTDQLNFIVPFVRQLSL